MKIKIIAAGALALALGAAAWWSLGGEPAARAEYNLAPVERRDLMKTITATGTLAALVTVEVGSEVSGLIKELKADYNSEVEKDQVIAIIDPQSYQTQVRQGEAELALAKAALRTQQAAVEKARAELANLRALRAAAKANVAEARATLGNAQREMERSQALVEKEFISRTDHDTAATAWEKAKAALDNALAQEEAAAGQAAAGVSSVAVAVAQMAEKEATILQKEATLEKYRVDLAKCVIRSPVNGVVIERSVDVGQTVAASLQAPTLFNIAQDLKRMEVSTSVDEADIGQIKEGQEAWFTVDAFGEKRFPGRVTQVRKSGEEVQNVVTYTVIISADNADLLLMPGMTANVEIVVDSRRGVLAVPSAALSFRPEEAGAPVEDGTAAAALPTSGPGGPGGSSGLGPERLAAELGLSDSQKEALKKVLEEQTQEKSSGGLFSMPGPPPRDGDQRAKLQGAVLAVLSPDQRRKYLELVREPGGKAPQTRGSLWVPGEGAPPTPRPVEVGLSDGSYIEVSGPDISEGLQVIVGLKR